MRFLIFGLVLLVFSGSGLALEILEAHLSESGLELQVDILFADPFTDNAKFIYADAQSCFDASTPVITCDLKIRVLGRDLGYRADKRHTHTVVLRDLGLTSPAYSATELRIRGDSEKFSLVKLPVIRNSKDYEHGRLRYLKPTSIGPDYNGFSSLSPRFDQVGSVFGISSVFTQSAFSDKLVAFDIAQSKVRWSSEVESGNHLNFLSVAPNGRMIAVGGRFSRAAPDKTNLLLVDALTGEKNRYLYGTEDLDVSASQWINNQILVSHSSITDKVVTPDSIVDHGIIKGVITWHDTSTGKLIRKIDSPILQADVVEQSSDQKFVAFAGYEGAAIVDAVQGTILFKIHMSDLYGPEYAECSNFGCGPNRSGFHKFAVSADKRTLVLTTMSGPLYVMQTERPTVVQKIELKTPGGMPVFVRAMRMNPTASSLYVYVAEHVSKPSTGHVLVYSIASGKILKWFQGSQVLGESGGNNNGSAFSDDFSFLFSSDSAEGFADSRMMRPASIQVMRLE